jgi:acetyl esterase/lipase
MSIPHPRCKQRIILYPSSLPMPLHPEAQAAMDARDAAGMRPVEELTPEQARAQSIRFALLTPGEPVARVRDIAIPGPQSDIPARLYYPILDPQRPTLDAPLPIVVFFHGGGWVVGNLETADATCRQWANALKCLVISVNYRHAPEHKYPAAAEDAYAATRWVTENARELQGSPTRLAVAGFSAGGNLAAVVSLMARDRGAPPIALQVLWAPVIDFDFDTPSYSENAEGYVLTRAGMKWFWDHYLNTPAEGAQPYASPIRAADLSNLPPALVLTAEFDPLRDEGKAYEDKLRAAGVPVKFHCYSGMTHAYLGAQALEDVAQAVRTYLFP